MKTLHKQKSISVNGIKKPYILIKIFMMLSQKLVSWKKRFSVFLSSVKVKIPLEENNTNSVLQKCHFQIV